jgi:hypothetical protein
MKVTWPPPADDRVVYGENDERDRQSHEKARGNAWHKPGHGGHGHGGKESKPVLLGCQPVQPGKDSIHLKIISPPRAAEDPPPFE